MSIAKVNELERRGEIIGAFELNCELTKASASISPALAEIYRRNEQRLQTKVESSDRWLLIGRSMVEHSGAMGDFGPPRTGAKPPMVTLVVPCYNAEKYLPATLESIRAQTYPHFECILVDDLSTDGTAIIARGMSRSDKRFRFFQHRANGGLAASRNSGIRLARGEFVAFLDADDLLAPRSLANRAEALVRFRDSELIAGSYDFSEAISDDFQDAITDAPAAGRAEFVDFVSSKGDCPFNANQPMLKRSVLVRMGGFPEKYPQAEDWRLWSKVLRAGHMFVSTPSIGSGYRQTAGSMIRRNPLLHVAHSRDNFFRAHMAFGSETSPVEIAYEDLYQGAPLFEGKWGYYYAQQQFVTRVFNFIGIELGRLDENGQAVQETELRDLVLRLVPDFYACVAGYTGRGIRGWLENGFKRYYGVGSLDAAALTRFHRAANRLLGCLFADVGWHEIGPARRLLPERTIPVRPSRVVDVVFFPHKKYHTFSFELLIPGLQAAGLSFIFVDSSGPYRDEGAYDAALQEHFVTYNEFVLSRIVPRSIVCMNDWDTVVKPVVKHANDCGIPTVGIVEGVQDFLDMDTGRKRNPYREVANVFLPGDFDRKYFRDSSQTLWITGVQRLDGLAVHAAARVATSAKSERRRKVVANVNFSYGVMTDCRLQWIADIRAACDHNGFELIVSQHPQDDGDLSAYNVSKASLYDLLADCDVFVSRFSGAILESLIIGCPVVYYNGHGELVDKFHDSLGDYRVANDPESLVDALAAAVNDVPLAGPFLKQHCDIDTADGSKSIDKTVDALTKVLAGSSFDLKSGKRFKTLLGGDGGAD